MNKRLLIIATVGLAVGSTQSRAVTIDFDDVVGTEVDVTTRYASKGVTLNAIANQFPLYGVYPAPPTLPTILGGVTTWTEGFPSALSPPQVAVAANLPLGEHPGDGGILISFAFDVMSVSVVGTDLGVPGSLDDESVTLTGYDAAGKRIGQVYSLVNLPGVAVPPWSRYDQTPATISMPGLRYVAFNYTDSLYGFFAMDDLTFTIAGSPIPETPMTLPLLVLGLATLCGVGRFFLHGPSMESLVGQQGK